MSGPAPPASTGHPPATVWVFGYGSLIWRPGFPFRHRQPALLEGWHRAFCRYSFHHRGKPDAPGLVVGLREGKSCVGMAYAIPAADVPQALDYLDEREGAGYHRKEVTLRLLDQITAAESATEDNKNLPENSSVSAWSYIPNRGHPSYFGEEDPERLTRLVATGQGQSGTALDYLRELIDHLGQMQVEEPELAAILRAAEKYRAENGDGGNRGPA